MNYQVIINPELGGMETGKIYKGISEKDYNLRFSKLLSEKLNRDGINNILVRTNDNTITNNDRVKFLI